MNSLLNNPWIVGIGGGIISGAIVYIVTSFLVKRKDRKESYLKISQANHEIINILKPYIADNGLPKKNTIDSLIASTARKYHVLSSELYPVGVICEELIREVIDNVYVSSDKKRDYINSLEKYINDLRTDNIEDKKNNIKHQIEQEMEVISKNRVRSINKLMALFLSMLTSLAVLMISVLVVFVEKRHNLTFSSDLFLPLIAGIVPICLLLPMMLFLKLQTQRRVIESSPKSTKENIGKENDGIAL